MKWKIMKLPEESEAWAYIPTGLTMALPRYLKSELSRFTLKIGCWSSFADCYIGYIAGETVLGLRGGLVFY